MNTKIVNILPKLNEMAHYEPNTELTLYQVHDRNIVQRIPLSKNDVVLTNTIGD